MTAGTTPMKSYPPTIRRCLEELQKLPGIGPKSAQRILFSLLDRGPAAIAELGQAFASLAEGVARCPTCRAYMEACGPCALCSDASREVRLLCIVETAADVLLIENTGEFKGLYHVLHGLLSPIKGFRPEQLGLEVLDRRLQEAGIEEVVLATPPTAEGEATASYLAAHLAGKVRQITRIAYGLPVGTDFQYVDAQTLARAFSGRKAFT